MNKLKEKIQEIGLDYKKEFIVLGVILAILLSISFYLTFSTGKIFVLILGICATFAFSFLFLSRYDKMIKLLQSKRQKEFVDLFTFFEIYISNGFNVYNALVNINDLAKPFLKEKLTILITEIDEDKSVTPFINFADCFNNLVIRQIMISCYQMIDQGNDSNYLGQYENLFSKISDEQRKEELETKFKRIDFANTLPLVGAGLVTVIVTLAIVEVIGGMMNGL